MKRVVFLFPTEWDAKQLDACRDAWASQFSVEYAEPSDWDCTSDLDVVRYIDDGVARYRGRVDGVTSSSDYPGATVAGAVATALGLPGPPPDAVIGCSHKFLSRQLQRDVVPEAVPLFDLVDPRNPIPPAMGFPCFVKPVKGAFSIMSGRVASHEALRDFFARPAAREFCASYMQIFNRLVERYTPGAPNGGWFVAEELLQGQQVTVEGFTAGSDVEILGITDSEMHPGTGSFARFVFPSQLPETVQSRMREIASRLMRHAGLRDAFFNIEMIYDETSDRIGIIEVNPRICGQFGDLYQKVLGTNSFAMALQLATGTRPVVRAAGSHAVAGSFPLRVFQPVRVERVPTQDDLRAAAALFPGTLIWPECEAGQELADFESIEDGHSARYGVVNLGAPDRTQLLQRFDAVRERLGYRFAPL